MTLSRPSEYMPAFARGSVWLEALTGLGTLIVLAVLTNFIVKHVVLRLALRILPEDGRHLRAIAARIANIAPALVIAGGIALVPHLPAWVVDVTRNVVAAFVILTIASRIAAIGTGVIPALSPTAWLILLLLPVALVGMAVLAAQSALMLALRRVP